MKIRLRWRVLSVALAVSTLLSSSATAQATRQVPYFGYYFVQDEEQGNFNYISEVNGYSNIAWIAPDHSRLTPTIGAQYDNAGLKLIVELGISEARLNYTDPNDDDQNHLARYLTDTYNELNAANLWDNVIAIEPSEEWHNRVIYGAEKDWATFSAYTEQTIGNECGAPPDDPSRCWIKARREFLVTKLQNLVAAIKARFPDKAMLLVDTSWSNEYNLKGAGSFWYHPVPSNLDILGMDAYMTSIDYTPDCGAAMQQKFIDDVRWEYDHVLAHYSQPILVVGQAFTSAGGVDWFFPMPSNCQLNWWYSVAQTNSRFFGLTWFEYGLSPGGVRYYPDQAQWLKNMYLHNQSIPGGAPDMLSPGQALSPNQSRTSMDGRYNLVYQGDGNLVLYQLPSWTPLWWSCTNGTSPGQAVMQGDGNFVIYDSGGTPLAWTATEGNPGAYLTVQPDGNVVIYTPTAPNASIWYSNGAGCL